MYLWNENINWLTKKHTYFLCFDNEKKSNILLVSQYSISIKFFKHFIIHYVMRKTKNISVFCSLQCSHSISSSVVYALNVIIIYVNNKNFLVATWYLRAIMIFHLFESAHTLVFCIHISLHISHCNAWQNAFQWCELR